MELCGSCLLPWSSKVSSVWPSSSEGRTERKVATVSALTELLGDVGVRWPEEGEKAGRRRQALGTRHVRQRMGWDCGLACALMVARDREWNEAARSATTRSVWTVDLAFVLRDFGKKVVFFTKTIGADPSYGELAFYRSEYRADRRRVDARFAEGKHWIRKASLSSDALLELVDAGFLVIALVDLGLLPKKNNNNNTRATGDDDDPKGRRKDDGEARSPTSLTDDLHTSLLSPYEGGASSLSPSWRRRTTGPGGGGRNDDDDGGGGGGDDDDDGAAASAYLGHYILLVGLTTPEDPRRKVIYRDPATDGPPRTIDPAELHAARTAHGTDEDLIIVDDSSDDPAQEISS